MDYEQEQQETPIPPDKLNETRGKIREAIMTAQERCKLNPTNHNAGVFHLGQCPRCYGTTAINDAAISEHQRQNEILKQQIHNIEQVLGRALGFPEWDGQIVTSEYNAEILAEMAAKQIRDVNACPMPDFIKPKTDHEIITAMCITFNHAYFVPDKKPGDFGSHMTAEEKHFLYGQMKQVFYNDLKHLLKI